MLKKNIRPNNNGAPVELTIGDDITVRFVKIGERVVSLAIDAPPERKIGFSNLPSQPSLGDGLKDSP